MSLSIPFLIGLFSAFHCIGMCGGIMAALSFGLKPEVRQSPVRMTLFVTAYNVGRVFSYAVAGALAGGLVGQVAGFLGPTGGQVWLQRAAAVILILIGLHLAGWMKQLHRIERIGVPLWQRIEPWARRLMPVKSPMQALLYGILWGWIPCGMVYTMLIAAASQGGGIESGLYMAFFGLGTLVPVAAAGVFVGRVRQLVQSSRVRTVLGVTVIVWGLVSLFYPDFVVRLGVDHGEMSTQYCTSPTLE